MPFIKVARWGRALDAKNTILLYSKKKQLTRFQTSY